MKKLFTGLFAAALMCVATTALAVDYTWTPIQIPGTVNIVPDNHYSYTATEDGIVTQIGEQNLHWYTYYEEDYDFESNESHPALTDSGFSSDNEKTFQVTKGTTYYLFSTGWSTVPVTFTFSDGTDLKPDFKIRSIEPAEGSAIGINENGGTGEINLFMNVETTYSEVYITSGILSSGTYPATKGSNNNVLGVSIRNAMLNLYSQGLKAGDPVTVHISGLSNLNGDLYNETGEIILEYTAQPAPIDLVDNNFPEVFKSFYAEGDPNAIVTFTFSGDVDPYKTSSVEGGDTTGPGPILYIAATTEEEGAIIQVHSKVQGNVVTFDLSSISKQKFAEFVNVYSPDEPNASFDLINVYDLQGNMAAGDGSEGSAGSYTFYPKVKIFEKANFNSSWTPGDGNSLTSANVITVQFDHADQIFAFAGIKFICGALSYIVPFSECTVLTDGDTNTKTVMAPIPEGYSTKSNVKVSLSGIESADGFEYDDNDIAAVFNPTYGVDVAFSPVNGSVVTELNQITVNTDAIFDRNYYPTLTTDANTMISYIGELDPGYFINLSPGLVLGQNGVKEGTTVTIKFPARAFYLDGDYSDEITLTYTIGSGGGVIDPEPDPEPSVEYKTISISPADNSELESLSVATFSNSSYRLDAVASTPFYLENAATGERINFDYAYTNINGAVEAFLNTELASGSYYLVVPQGAFKLTPKSGNDGNEYYNTQTRYYYIVKGLETGITTVAADANGFFEVYNTNGALVMKTADPAELTVLKGLYIINGKKMILK